MPEKVATVDVGPNSSPETQGDVAEHNDRAVLHNHFVDAVPGDQARVADAQRKKEQAEKDLQNARNALANAHVWEKPFRQQELGRVAALAGAAQSAWAAAVGTLNQDQAEANRDVSALQKEIPNLKKRVAWEEENLPKLQPSIENFGLSFVYPLLPSLAAPAPAEPPLGAPATGFDGKPITYTEYKIVPQKITIQDSPVPNADGITFDFGLNIDAIKGSDGTLYTRHSPSEPFHREF
ncbi:hypothetical protein Srot_2108 [Segniliparus rotundus DSM 44985]|uniref:Uncharacterized protein n=1 Tax=Segniliparus rotundus (strain ATCC BAA-972 / CDC 1076 / CIP 108378 / DSM 44985 / JCM 13578) TaxID=640132 RepID=D6Z9D2_SEGRD|nr:hypothetical protein [Segniliparus rotundus]ADG98562.1 hypothetical protein Srot_2108 [Segniliparus rotundus DSM 44985]